MFFYSAKPRVGGAFLLMSLFLNCCQIDKHFRTTCQKLLPGIQFDYSGSNKKVLTKT